MRLGAYIYTKLSSDTALDALIEDRIYPVYLPQGDHNYPCIVYMVDNEPHAITKHEPSTHDTAKVTFHIWADHRQGQQAYDDIDAIDQALRDLLDFVSKDTVASITVDSCRYLSSRDGRDENLTLFLREATYNFIVRN